MWPSFRGDAHNSGLSSRTLAFADSESATSVHLGGLIWATAVWKRVSGGTRVYVGSTNRVFACIEVPDQQPGGPMMRVVWTFVVPQMRADGLIDSAASLSPDGAQVVVPGGDGCLYALDAASGAVQWKFDAALASDVSGTNHDSGVIVNSFEGNVRHSRCGRRVLAGCDNASIYCVDASDRPGTLLWRVETGMMVWTVGALLTMAAGRDVAVFGSLDRCVYVLDELTGERLASMDTGGEVKASPAVVAINATMDRARICVCNSNGSVHLLSLSSRDGFELTREGGVDLPGELYGSPAVLGDRVFVTDMTGGVTCLRMSSGDHNGAIEREWRVDTYGYIAASPLAVRGGMVVVSTGSGFVLALSAASGALEGSARLARSHRRALNASPVVLPDGRVCVGSYDGNVYVSALRRANGLELDGLLLPLDSDGRRRTHAEVVSEPDADVISLVLRPYDNDARYMPTARIDASTLRVAVALLYPGGATADARDLYEVQVSPDGRYVNLLPIAFLPRDCKLRVTIRGEFRPAQANWVADRVASLVRFGGGSVPFECDAVDVNVRGRGDRAPELARPSRWELGGLFCSQPTVLETYIPAALDGQGFVLHSLGHEPGRRDFYLLCCPVLPAVGPSERVVAVREPEKVVLMRATAEGSCFRAKAERAFTFSAMGGTLAMDEFRVFGRIMPGGHCRVEFYASVSCLGVRGNGKSYQFSPELVGEMCDARLRSRAVGGAVARLQPTPAPPPRSNGPPLVVWVDAARGAMRASLGHGELPPCGAARFVDCERIGDERECVPAHPQSPPFFSSDGLMLESALRPVVRAACSLGVHPNAVTVSSIVTTAAMVYAHLARTSSGTCGVALAVPALAMYKWVADVLDGAIARTCDRSSKLGGALDTLADATFSTVAVVLLISARPGYDRLARDPRVWAVAALASALPWLALAGSHGTGALSDHASFKNGDSVLGTAAWLASENTFVLCASFAVAYALLACPSARGLYGAATRDPAVVVTLLIFAALAARRLTAADDTPAVPRAASAVALAVPAGVIALAVACLRGSPGGQWTAVAITAVIAACALLPGVGHDPGRE